MRKRCSRCSRIWRQPKSGKGSNSNDLLFNITLYNKLQNDISLEDSGLRKRYHILRRTRESWRTSPLYSDPHQKAQSAAHRRIVYSQKFDEWVPGDREGRQAHNRGVKDKASDWGEDVWGENVVVGLLSKNYIVTQKAEYMRFANQINAMVANSKEINSHLTLLGTKFE